MSVSALLTLAFSIDWLSEFFGTLPVSSIEGNTRRRYLVQRQKPRKVKGRTVTAGASTVRRELGVLQAALNHCEAEGYLITAPRV